MDKIENSKTMNKLQRQIKRKERKVFRIMKNNKKLENKMERLDQNIKSEIQQGNFIASKVKSGLHLSTQVNDEQNL